MYGVTLNKENIKSVLEDFNKLTNIRIGFYSYDQKEYLAYPQKNCLFCELIKKNPLIEQRCTECDRFAFKQAKQSGKLYLYECHAGLYEAISPIIMEGKLLGYLMIGQVLPQKPSMEKWNDFCKLFKFYEFDLKSVQNAFFILNHMDRGKLDTIVRVMDRNAKYIYLSKSVKIQYVSKVQEINAYIENHIQKPITVSDISNALGMSMSYLNRLIQKEYHNSPGKYVLELKIKAACTKLEESALSIKEIAFLTGFADQNYFSRMFKKVTKMTPKQYREMSIRTCFKD